MDWVAINLHQLLQHRNSQRKIERIRFSIVTPRSNTALVDFGSGLKTIMRGHPAVFDFAEVDLSRLEQYAPLLSIQVMFAEDKAKPILVQRDAKENPKPHSAQVTEGEVSVKTEIRVPERYRKRKKEK